MSPADDLTRREFIRTTTTTSLALGTAAWTARSYAAVANANNRLRLAIIGCGGIASHHLGELLKMRTEENIEITDVCDVYDRRARAFQSKIEKETGKKPDTVKDYRRILERKELDYVLITTPEHSHAYLTLDALDAGKHVYVEKPLTHTIEEAQAVVAKVRQTNLQLQCGVQGMADDSYSSANTAIRDGKIGTVVSAQIDYVRDYKRDSGPWRSKDTAGKPKPDELDWEAWLKPAPYREWDARRYHDWRCYADYSGGIATDLFIHRLTRLMRACSLTYPDRVVGMGGIYTWPDGRDLPDSFEMLMEYGPIPGITNGMTVHILGTMANEFGNKHCIRGTDATLVFTATGWEIANEKGETVASHAKTGGEDVNLHHKNHHKAIREGAALYCPVELALYGVVACCMGNLSWADKRAYRWDAAAEKAVPV